MNCGYLAQGNKWNPATRDSRQRIKGDNLSGVGQAVRTRVCGVVEYAVPLSRYDDWRKEEPSPTKTKLVQTWGGHADERGTWRWYEESS